jgi:hypothetical protein
MRNKWLAAALLTAAVLMSPLPRAPGGHRS